MIKPHLSAGSIRRLQIYPISMLLMPGSHQYDSGWLTEPPVVTRSSSRSHYQVVLLANEFVSNHVICKCLTQLRVKHATVLPTGTEVKHISVGISFRKQLCNPQFSVVELACFFSEASNRNPNWNSFETLE